MNLVSYLKWPASSVFSIKMTKKVLKEFASDTKEVLLSSILKLEWTGSLKPNHVGIPALINEEFAYDEIVFIEITLREKDFADRIARLMQKTIPYPLIIGFKVENEVCFNIAEKAIHKQQKDKRVVNQDAFFFSDWLNLNLINENQKNYLANLALDKVGGTNLKEYFDKLIRHIYDECRQIQVELEEKEKVAQKLKNHYSKEKNAAKKAEIHKQALELANIIKDLKSRMCK